MLDGPDAEAFVTDVLEIPDITQRLLQDRQGLLNDVIRRFHGEEPFHNMFSMQHEDMGIPSLEENVRRMRTRQGGLCWTQNSAMCLLLQNLGYDAYPALSTVVHAQPSHLPNHVLTIVRGLVAPASRHLVEVGMGVTTLSAIRLDDFQHESSEYSDYYQTYKFIKRDGNIIRMHKFDPTNPKSKQYYYSEGIWGHFCYFNEAPCEWAAIREALDLAVYSNPAMFFNYNLRAFVFSEDKVKMLGNDVSIIKMADGGTVSKVLKGKEEIVKAIAEITVWVDEAVIRRAVTRWLNMKDA